MHFFGAPRCLSCFGTKLMLSSNIIMLVIMIIMIRIIRIPLSRHGEWRPSSPLPPTGPCGLERTTPARRLAASHHYKHPCPEDRFPHELRSGIRQDSTPGRVSSVGGWNPNDTWRGSQRDFVPKGLVRAISLSLSLSLSIYIYIHIHTYTHWFRNPI